jgi:hypothetical protein
MATNGAHTPGVFDRGRLDFEGSSCSLKAQQELSMSSNLPRPPLSKVADERGYKLHKAHRRYSEHADEAQAFTRLMETSELVSRALLAHPEGTVASIEGYGYWLALHSGALHLASAGLLRDFLDDDVILVSEINGLSAAELDLIEKAMRAWLSHRAYLDFDPLRLNALLQLAYPSAPDSSL